MRINQHDTTMHCPYCDDNLTPGFLYHDISSRPTWLPEHVRPFLGFSPINGDPIGKFWTGRIFCHRCDRCMKIVIDIEDERNV